MSGGFRKKLKILFREKLTIKFIPHSGKKVRTLSISLGWFFLLGFSLVVYLFGSTFLSHFYYDRYQISLREINDLYCVKEENVYLKKEIARLGDTANNLSARLVELEQKSREIRKIINKVEGIDYNFAASQNELEAYVLNFLSQNSGNFPLELAQGGGDDLILQNDIFGYLNDIENEVEYIQNRLPQQESNITKLARDVDTYRALQAATPKIWPLADDGNAFVSSEFGYRKDPFTGKRKFHEGIDIGVWYGTPVLATAAGRVIFAGWKSGYGNTVIIEHGFGYSTLYAHNQRVVVREGQWVKRGKVIAYSGNSGRSEGPHLHYEVRVNGVPKNPRQFLPKGD